MNDEEIQQSGYSLLVLSSNKAGKTKTVSILKWKEKINQQKKEPYRNIKYTYREQGQKKSTNITQKVSKKEIH